MDYKISTSIPVMFEEVDTPPYLDSVRFQAVKVWICHTGLNLNNSVFSKEVITAMMPSLAGIPILGYISIDNVNQSDFNGHEERLVIDENGIKLEYIGRAYGCILETNNAKFEMKDGKEFLTCEGLLWKKFSECIDIFNRDGFKGQSMELNPDSIKGNFAKDGHYHFTEAKFDGLCILGDTLTPAMTGSIIEKFSIKDIAIEYQELLNEINNSIKQFSLQNQSSTNLEVDNINSANLNNENLNYAENLNSEEGGTQNLDKKLELIAKYNLTLEQLDFSVEEMSMEDLEIKLKDFSIKTNSEPKTEFTLTANQLMEELRNELRTEKMKDYWGDEVSKYSLVDYKDNVVFAYDRSDNYKLFGFEFTITGDKISINFETKKRKKFEIVDFEEGVELSFEAFPKEAIENAEKVKETELTTKFETEKVKLETELERLKEFETTKLSEERQEAEIELFSIYEEKLTDDEKFKELKTNSKNFTIEELEKELALLYVKKTASFSFKKNENRSIKINVNKSTDVETDPYGGLIEKTINK